MRFSYIDLFSGIGGFRLALDALGGECLLACEIDQRARRVYEMNFGAGHPFPADVADVDVIPPCDVLCAGFPCQPFSVAGEKRGREDARGGMFDHILRITRDAEAPPRCLFLENVPGLLSVDGGRAFAEMRAGLESLGYRVGYFLNDAREFGVPQSRRRVFIIAFADGVSAIRPPAPPFPLCGAAYNGECAASDILLETGQIEEGEVMLDASRRARGDPWRIRVRGGERCERRFFNTLRTAGWTFEERRGGNFRFGGLTFAVGGRRRDDDVREILLSSASATLAMGFPAEFAFPNDLGKTPASNESRARSLLGNAVVPAVAEAYMRSALEVLEG